MQEINLMKEGELKLAVGKPDEVQSRQNTLSTDTFGAPPKQSDFRPPTPTDYGPPQLTAKDLEFALILAGKNAEIERWNN